MYPVSYDIQSVTGAPAIASYVGGSSHGNNNANRGGAGTQ